MGCVRHISAYWTRSILWEPGSLYIRSLKRSCRYSVVAYLQRNSHSCSALLKVANAQQMHLLTKVQIAFGCNYVFFFLQRVYEDTVYAVALSLWWLCILRHRPTASLHASLLSPCALVTLAALLCLRLQLARSASAQQLAPLPSDSH